jgi:predicted permease
MEILLKDLRYGCRMLASKPGFTAVIVITLALGIGANSAIFSAVNAVLLRPLPYREPGRLVLLRERFPKSEQGDTLVPVSAAEFVDYENGNSVFEGLAGFESITKNLTGQSQPERVKAARVSANLFSILGAQPAFGRTFTTDEDNPGKDDVVVIGYQLWQRVFGSDISIIGKSIRLSDRPYLVTGVMRPEFRFPISGVAYADSVEMWVPLALSAAEIKARGENFNIGVIGRLGKGVSIEQARNSADTIAGNFQERMPELYRDEGQIQAVLVYLAEEVSGKTRPFLFILLASVGLLLLLASANVANMLLARASTRRREIAIRAAMGAGSARIVRLLLTESILVALLGGSAGLLLAGAGVRLIQVFGPEAVPRLREASVDLPMICFTALVTVLTGIMFGLAPALQSVKVNLIDSLKESGRQGGPGARASRIRGTLVAFETAVAVILLVGAGLLLSSLIRVVHVRTGFDPGSTLIASTAFSERYASPEQRGAVQRDLLEKLTAIPGVQAAATATHLPLTYGWSIGFTVQGSLDENKLFSGDNNVVSTDYFRAMGIPLLRGRSFGDQDRSGTEPVVIVNETMARRFWPGDEPIGRRIRWGAADPAAAPSNPQANPWLTVVGLAADVTISALEAETRPQIYMPLSQQAGPGGPAFLVVKIAGDPLSYISPVRAAIWSVDKDLPVYDARPMKEIVAESIASRRFLVLMLGVFAAVALLLSMAGLYGVISYTIAERRQEIGIRMALGASRLDILRLVGRQGMAPAILGTAAGLLASLILTPLVSGLLFGVTATDPVTLGAVSVLVLAAALGSSLVPARRATWSDPMDSLRYD